MESVMTKVIDYTNRWNAIILIDEADIFVEQRETNMIVKNAMVGIFLKLLEYHNGIIFMTTNRLDTIDEALKSRIDLMLYYEALSEERRKKVWTAMFNNWGINIDKKCLNRLARHNLNGREIRNYMKVIFSIHRSEGREMTGETILTSLDDCFKLTNEFKNNLSATMLYN